MTALFHPAYWWQFFGWLGSWVASQPMEDELGWYPKSSDEYWWSW